MKYVIEIPDDLEQALEMRATATGSDVPHLIKMAVASFVHSDVMASQAGRRTDPPPDVSECVPSCDLPRTTPQFVAIQRTSQRTPDPVSYPA